MRLLTHSNWVRFVQLRAADEVSIAFGVEDWVLRPENAPAYAPVFGVLLHTLYDMDVLTELGVSGWAEAREGAADPALAGLRGSKWVNDLLELLDADSDEEEEEDEEDE